MRKLFALVLLLVSIYTPATPIPPSFSGLNFGADPTAAAFVWPKVYTSSVRLWDVPCCEGASPINAAPKWRNIATSSDSSAWNWTRLDALIASAHAHNAIPLYTIGLVPSWVNGTGNPVLTAGAQQQALFDFGVPLMTHLGPPPFYVSMWNEITEPTWWTGNNTQQVQIHQGMYPIIHAAGGTALSAVIDMGQNPQGAIVPTSPFYQLEQLLAGCAAGGLPCFDVLDMHGYPGLVFKSVAAPEIIFSPALLPTMVNNERAIATANGFGSYPLIFDEGFAGSNAGDSTTVTDTDAFAGAQARYLIMLASLGVSQVYPFVYGTECSIKNACGSLAGNSTNNTLGLNKPGLAVRNTIGWLIGSTFTTPMTRVKTSNSIRTAANATSTIGKLSGPGGCSGGVDTAGVLPVNWSSSNAHSAAGMSLYLVGSGTETGIPYIDVRVCGTDTTSGAGQSTASIVFDSAIASTPAQDWVVGGYLKMSAGSSANTYAFITTMESRNSGGSYVEETNYYTGYYINQPLSDQYFEVHTRTDNASSAFMRPSFTVKYYYNSGTLPVDITIRIGKPTAETGSNSTQWIGNITETNGTLGIIAWDEAGVASSYTTPAGFDQYRDMYGVSHPIVANTVSLPADRSPIIIENAAWKGWAP